LFSRWVSNEEGDEILVWSGDIDCVGYLTMISGGCEFERYGVLGLRMLVGVVDG